MNRKLKWASAIGLLVAVVGIGAALAYATAPVTASVKSDRPASITGWYTSVEKIPAYVISATGAGGPGDIDHLEAAIDTTLTGVGVTSSNPTTVSIYNTTGMPILSDGKHVVWVRAIDTAGNWSVWTTSSVTFWIDTLLPSTPPTPTVAAAAGRNVTVSAYGTTDPGIEPSGISTYTIQYSLVKQPFAPITASSQVVTSAVTTTSVLAIDSEEATTTYVRVLAADLAGNVATSGVASVNLDGSAPGVTFDPTGDSFWTTPTVNATVTISDNNSGIASYAYQVKPATGVSTGAYKPVTATTASANTTQVVLHIQVPLGDYQISVVATDNAGNGLTWGDKVVVYKRDGTVAPRTLSGTTPASPNGVNGTWTSMPAVTLQATDTVWAVPCVTWYAWNGGTKTVSGQSNMASVTVSGAPTFPDNASTVATLTFASVDTSGNAEATQTMVFTVYPNQPVVTITLNHTPNDAKWLSSATTATISSGDSSATTIFFKLENASEWTTASAPTTSFAIPEGVHTITAYAVDSKGYAGAVATKKYQLDVTDPVIGEFTTPIVNTAYPTLVIPVTDSGSGLASGTADVEDHATVKGVVAGNTLSFTIAYPLTAGPNVVIVNARDVAGNAADTVYRTITYNPAATVPTVNASSVGHGLISPAGITSYSLNTSATFTIVPEEGYHVANVIVDGVSKGAVESYTLNVGAEDHTIVASFAMTSFAMTITAPANGTISGPASANYGTNAVYTITPASGFHLVGVTDNLVSQGALASYTVFNVQGTHTIAAMFEADVTPPPSTFTITGTAGSNGTLSVLGAQTVAAGSNLTVSITPNGGYHIADVLVDGASVGAVSSHTFTNVSGNRTISATFAIDTFAMTITTPTNGTISGPASANYGTNAVYTITPPSGFHVVGVTDNGVAQGALASYTVFNVQGTHTIAATFEADVTPPPSTFTITGTAGTHGSLSIVGAHTVAAGSNLTVNVDADAGYHIADVLVGGVSVGAVHSYTFTNVAANNTISATFAADVTPPPSTFTITGTAGANGTMSVIGATSVSAGSNLTVIMTPNTYYAVSSVLVDGVSVGAVPAYTFSNVAANHTISVTFVHSAKIWTALSFKSSPYTSYRGHKFVFTGKISPSSMASGTRITIWMRKSGQEWRKLGTVYTNGYDNYSYTLYNGSRTHGKYYVRAKYAGNSVYASCYSPYKTVYIK